MPENTIKLLEKLLDYSSAKQRVLSENISNVSTKGYKRKDVEFDDFLSNEMKGDMKATNNKHISFTQNSGNNIKEVYTDDDNLNSGVNNVDVNKEMAELAKNQLMFKFGVKKLQGYYSTIQNVIRGGR